MDNTNMDNNTNTDTISTENSDNNVAVENNMTTENKAGPSKIKKILVGLAVVVGIPVIGGIGYVGAQSVTVDNPTDSEVVVKIDDGENIKVSANASVKTKIKSGEHTLYVGGEEKTKFKKGAFDYGSILNPTGSIYVIKEIKYGKVNDLPHVTIEIDGETYSGPFEKISDYYIKDTWDYSLNDTFPEEVETKSGSAKKKKVFRKEDFITEYKIMGAY